ncbi:hypothetical protein BP5796_06631 [Coleophoma crateriformis]|uniref:Glutaminase n=1 Tax=Coleophoma crateriformis TaxID=565419 RepID=A0A3D8RPC8_9HELO|nr:hypothetical protein BP5796_06631 [Coleophoma crateriformis]
MWLSLKHSSLVQLFFSAYETVVATPTYSPIHPPSYPLAVRNPYLSLWLPGDQVEDLPTATPQFWAGQDLSLGILARVDGTTYKLFGVPGSVGSAVEASVNNATYSSTHSIFGLTAGSVTFTLDFFSPISPSNYLRQSLPFSYVTVSTSSSQAHDIQIYSDIDESWTGQSGSTVSQLTTSGNLSLFQLSVAGAATYSETNLSQALWGETVLAAVSDSAETVSSASGAATTVRNSFASSGSLSGNTSTFVAEDVVALAYDLGQTSSASINFAIGYVREQAINYLGNARTGYYRATYQDTASAVSFFFNDYSAAYSESLTFDASLEQKATASAGTNYSDILTLTPRQAFGGTELTIPDDTLDTSDVMAFLKEISSDGNVNTLDVIFPAFPIFYVVAPEYIRLLLEPVLQYTESGAWTQPFAIHDIGTHYPNATGHDDQVEEDMPVEESGNIILLAYAYITATSNYDWGSKYQSIFQKYADYLSSEGLDEAVQLATNDCCGALANQTNLAIKAAIALNAYGTLFNDTSYSNTGISFATELYTNGLALDSSKTHFTLQYGTDVEFANDTDYAVVFNIYPDTIFGLATFPSAAFSMLADYYPTIQGQAGVPLDSRVDWSSTFWTSWAAAASPGDNDSTRTLFINNIWAFLTNGLNTAPFSDRWYAVPGSGGLIGGSGDLIGGYDRWRNRPVVGGHFAILALNGPGQF